MTRLGETVRTAKAVADRTRVRILAALSVRRLCVCELTAIVGASQPVVSRHLGVLRSAGLVEDVRDGRWVEYRLAPCDPGSLAAAVLGAVSGLRAGDPDVAEIAEAARRVDRSVLRAGAAGAAGRNPWSSGSRSSARAAASATSRPTRRGSSSRRGVSRPTS